MDLHKHIDNLLEFEILRLQVLENVDRTLISKTLTSKKQLPSDICKTLELLLIELIQHRHDVPHERSDRHNGLGWSSRIIMEKMQSRKQELLDEMLQTVRKCLK